MILTEKQMLKKLDNAKNVLLVEPKYNSTHPPIGLSKIKTYLELQGKKVKFARTILPEEFDLICITTLFTYDSKFVMQTIKNRGLWNQKTPILVGGIFASMMPKWFDQFRNMNLFKGYSQTLDLCVPDREILDSVEDPWDTYSYVFTSRGCVNKCPYCVVWKIEPKLWVNSSWKNQIFDDKPNVMVSDNNLSAMPFQHLKEVIDYLVKKEKKVMFNSGFDCKYITDKMAKQLARVKFVPTGMRTAFDRIEEDGVFQTAIEKLIKAGVPPSKIEAYVLFNFNDRPKDAYHRARACADLKITPYPQKYTPLTAMNRKNAFVGKHWTAKLANTFRFFWLLRGLYNKHSFDDFMKMKKTIKEFKLTDQDIEMWNNNGVKK